LENVEAENVIILVVLVRINTVKVWLQQFIFLSHAKIQGVHPAEANLGYSLLWFQSLQLPATQSESPLVPK
jgi:hypothetical protein